LGKENCPCFNSFALELYQHKIPKLSNYFISLNDDFFINNKIKLNDFYDFKKNKIKYYYERRLVLGKPLSQITQKIIQKYTPKEKYYFWACHMPRMFNKEDIEEIIKENKKESEQTKKSKIRNNKNIQLFILYGYYLISKKRRNNIFTKY
jgi:hypothetical protein